MMYVEYPELTEQERIQGLSPLDLEAIEVPIDSLDALITGDTGIESFSIFSHLERPVFQIQFNDGTTSLVFADTGDTVQPTTQASAEQSANIFAKNAGLGEDARFVRTLEMDQWTVYGGFSAHRPLHQVALDNSRGTILYISNSTGQVVRDTHAWERVWIGSAQPFTGSTRCSCVNTRTPGSMWSSSHLFLASSPSQVEPWWACLGCGRRRGIGTVLSHHMKGCRSGITCWESVLQYSSQRLLSAVSFQ